MSPAGARSFRPPRPLYPSSVPSRLPPEPIPIPTTRIRRKYRAAPARRRCRSRSRIITASRKTIFGGFNLGCVAWGSHRYQTIFRLWGWSLLRLRSGKERLFAVDRIFDLVITNFGRGLPRLYGRSYALLGTSAVEPGFHSRLSSFILSGTNRGFHATPCHFPPRRRNPTS